MYCHICGSEDFDKTRDEWYTDVWKCLVCGEEYPVEHDDEDYE